MRSESATTAKFRPHARDFAAAMRTVPATHTENSRAGSAGSTGMQAGGGVSMTMVTVSVLMMARGHGVACCYSLVARGVVYYSCRLPMTTTSTSTAATVVVVGFCGGGGAVLVLRWVTSNTAKRIHNVQECRPARVRDAARLCHALAQRGGTECSTESYIAF